MKPALIPLNQRLRMQAAEWDDNWAKDVKELLIEAADAVEHLSAHAAESDLSVRAFAEALNDSEEH